jgi:anti-sigma factor (TIGR02949 family)
MSDDKNHSGQEEIGCIEAINALYAYLDGELSDPETITQFEHHLTHCRHCYSRTEMETALTEKLKKSTKGKAPEKLQNRLRNLIDRF